MKYLFALAALNLTGCTTKPAGLPRCWDVTSVIPHDIARSSWYYLKLKDPESGRTSYLDTIIFRPYATGDKVCIQKYEDKGISVVKYIPIP